MYFYFFFDRPGDNMNLPVSIRRQRQMCSRDRSERGGVGVNPSSFFKPKFTGFSNHSEMDFWHHNMSLKSLRNGLLTPQYESIWVFWHHNMSQYESQITQKWTFDTTIWVASPIYALLSVIRQQMSPFDPFRGGVAKRGQCPLFLPFFLKGERPLIAIIASGLARLLI